MNKLLSELNPEQNNAVAAPLGHMLVLAGAGSGKTRVLVHRIAYLITTKQISPFNILAVTFTNKAANEMRARLEKMLGQPLYDMWVGTFHGLAHRLLRIHWQEAGLLQNFAVIDAEDQLRVIKRIHKLKCLDEDSWPSKQSQWYINKNKDEGLRSGSVINDNNPNSKILNDVYRAYEEVCERDGLVDFAELLLRSRELWQKNTDVLLRYQRRFQHFLIDEFQDTNNIQYEWIKALADDSKDIMIVGDDDQSIYSWRGAKAENILRFSKDFKDVNVIRLEQNYRSTSTILSAANGVIANNSQRLGKNLWTKGASGEKIKIYAAYNEIDEAQFIVSTIRGWMNSGNNLGEAAILYRSNAQSRILEESFIEAGIPYRIYGGLRFFERAEIKDAVAYLRLLINRHDNDAFERALNTPARGLGNVTLESIRTFSLENKISLWEATQIMAIEKKLSDRARNAAIRFLALIDSLAQNFEKPLSLQVEETLQVSGLRAHFAAKKKIERDEAKLENLDELVAVAERFALSYERGGYKEIYNLPPLHSFLAHTALEAGEYQAKGQEDSVQMMTLHSAKGLEFPLVFLSGMEEYLFPHQMSMKSLRDLEEERRLCYVGMTRAMQKLYLTYASMRRVNGNNTYRQPSRFINEIPEELLAKVY